MSQLLVVEGRNYYRKLKSQFMMGVTVSATILTLVPLFLILGYLIS